MSVYRGANVELVKDPTQQHIEAATGLVYDATDMLVALAVIGTEVAYWVSELKGLTAL